MDFGVLFIILSDFVILIKKEKWRKKVLKKYQHSTPLSLPYLGENGEPQNLKEENPVQKDEKDSEARDYADYCDIFIC